MTTTTDKIATLKTPYGGWATGYVMRAEKSETGVRYWLCFGHPCGTQIRFDASEIASIRG